MNPRFDTPILFLIFNRPDVTRKVFEQIRLLKPYNLYVAADGPREDKTGEYEICQKTRNIILSIDWECDVKTLYRENNLGCKLAVNSAVTWFFSQVDEGIILEDDCYPNLSFFKYCQELLEIYRYHQNIYLIGGTSFQAAQLRIKESYYFTNYAQIWGWASWKRAWHMNNHEYFDYDSKTSPENLNHIFNSKPEEKYWITAFDKCKKGEINTWDYQWVYYIWKNKGVSITPKINLIENIGFQNNSTHQFLSDSYKSELKSQEIFFPLVHPQEIKINKQADIRIYKNIYSHSPKRLFRLFRENSSWSILKYLIKNRLKQFQN